MNQFVILVICVAFVLWCAAIAVRHRRWAFMGWLPFTLACALGTVAWISMLLHPVNSGGGAAEGFSALGAGMAFLYLLVCPVLLFVSILFKPRSYPPAVVITAILGIGIVVALAVKTIPNVEIIPVQLVFQRSDGTPISNVLIDYETRQNVNGFSPPVLNGHIQTDQSGRVTVFTRVTHVLRLHARRENFENTELTISNAGPVFGTHQCTLTWETHLPSDRWPKGQREMFDLPIGKELTGIIFLPNSNEIELPYPEYNPSWAHK